MTEFFKSAHRTREQILAYNESAEIVDLFNFWRKHADDFRGLREHLRDVCRKGPTLREAEKPSASSNRPRNDAVACVVAGMLLNAGVPVVAVEKIRRRDFLGNAVADVTLSWKDTYIDLECKRPQTEEALVPLAKRARAQLGEPTRECRPGIIAIDCSTIARPSDTLLEYRSGFNPEAHISARLQSLVPRCKPQLTPDVLGLILLARVAGMMQVNESRVLGPAGTPIRSFRPDTIMSWVVVGNSEAPGADVLEQFAMRVHEYMKAHRPREE